MLNKLTNDAIIEKRPCRREAEGPLFEVSIEKYYSSAKYFSTACFNSTKSLFIVSHRISASI